MSSKRNSSIILIVLMLAFAVFALSACTDQSPAPTATAVPTEAPAVPTEEPAAPTEEPAAPTEEPEVPAATEEVPAEEPAETADTAEVPAEEPAGTEETADVPAEEPAGTEETADVPAEEPAAEQPETEQLSDEDTVATVDGQKISKDSFVELAVFNRYQYINMYYQYAQMYAMYGLSVDSLNEQMEDMLGENGKESLGMEAIDQLTYDRVLEIEAENRGLEITEEQVYEQLKGMFGYEDPAAEDEPVLGMDSFNIDAAETDDQADKNAEFRAFAETVLADSYNSAVSFDFLMNYAKHILMDNTMFEEELNTRVFEEEQVNARHILVENEETAKEILSKLQAGEDWAELAKEYSLDTSNKDDSGALGWFGRGMMVTEFEEAAFALEPGQISEPVQTAYGYHIIASDGKEVRPLEGDALDAAQNALYEEWTMGMRAKHDIQTFENVWLEAMPTEPAFVPLDLGTEETAAEDEIVVDEPFEFDEVPEEETAETEGTEETPAEEVPAEEPAETEVTEETPAEEVPAEETAETEVTEETPAEEAPAEETAETEVTEETPAEETPAEETAETEVTEETPAEETPAEEAAVSEEESCQIVASVDGEGVCMEDFLQSATFSRYQYLNAYNQYVQMYKSYGLPIDSLNSQAEAILGEAGKERLGLQAIDELTYNIVLDREAEKAGLSISEEEVYTQLKSMFSYEDPNADAASMLGQEVLNIDPSVTDDASDRNAEFRAYAELILNLSYGGDVYFDYLKNYAKHMMLDDKLFAEELAAHVFESEQVNARHILVEDEETAKEVLAKLEAGEDWDALAAEYNKDSGTNLGWFGRGVMVTEFEEAAFALEPGQISQPVKTQFGYHIIASDGKEMRPLEGTALETAQKQLYAEWTEGLRANHDIQNYPEVWMDAVPMEPAFNPPAAEEPAAEEPAVEETAAEEPAAEEPAAEEPAAEETAAGEPAAAETSGRTPIRKMNVSSGEEKEAEAAPKAENSGEPTEWKPVRKMTLPAAEETAAEEPAAEEPAAEEPADEEPAAEETAAEEPAVEQTAAEEPAAEEPAAEETAAEEPAAEETAEAETEAPDTDAVVASVDGDPISVKDFVDTAIFNRYQIIAEYQQYAQFYSMFGLPLDDINASYEVLLGDNEEARQKFGQETVNNLTLFKMADKEAEKTGITVDDAEVVSHMKESFGYTDAQAETESSLGLETFTIGEEENGSDDTEFRVYVDSTLSMAFDGKITYDFWKEYVKHNMLLTALFDKELEGRVFEAEQINARHILVEDEETAKEILARLEAGEDWAAIASELSIDTSNKDNSGALGWFTRGTMVSEFEDAAFALEPGEISDPVRTAYGYHIIACDGKETRPLEDAALEAAKQEVFTEWYQSLPEKYTVESYPEVWMPLVPTEPVFEPLVIDAESGEGIPTFTIGGDEDEEEAAAEDGEEELSISSTEQGDDGAISLNSTEQGDDGAISLDNTEQEDDGAISLDNTEQDEGAFLLDNDEEAK